MTEKLYDKDSFLTEFDGVVLTCEKENGKYKSELDKTVFFPNEGGQNADKGVIDDIEITDVKIYGDKIYH